MEESGLDDFFAKKDKSKKKTKAKITASDILPQGEAEVGEEKPKKAAKKKTKKKEKDNTAQNNSTEATKTAEDEEWVDYEAEEKIDYSGLRIHNLQISGGKAEEEGQERDRECGSDDEEGEGGEKRDGSQGVWKKSQATPLEQEEPEPAPPVPVKPPEPAPAPAKLGKYVPPGARGGDSGAPSSASRMAMARKKKIAPNLSSQSDFPTLGGGPVDSYEGDRGQVPAQFEVVRGGGGRQMEDPRLQKTKVEIGNKFDALTEET